MGTSSSRSGNNAPSCGDWTRAKHNVTSLTTGTGSSVRSAVGSYVSAIGGRRAVSHSGTDGGARGKLSSSVGIGQALGHFLGQAGAEGLDKTLNAVGLSHLIGAHPLDVLSGIADYVCGNGGPLDESTGRAAVTEVLAELYDDSDDAYSDIRDRLDDQISSNLIVELMSLFLTQSIFLCFLSDLGDRIESNAVSASQAGQLEQRILEFIKNMVEFDLGEIDPLNFDWQGIAGKELIERNLAAALDQLVE